MALGREKKSLPFWRLSLLYPRRSGQDFLHGVSRSLTKLRKRVEYCFESTAHLFSHARKSNLPFLPVGQPLQNRSQNPAPAGCLFSTRKSRSEVPERGDFGAENCLGKGGVDRVQKKDKRMRKKKVGQFRQRELTSSACKP